MWKLEIQMPCESFPAAADPWLHYLEVQIAMTRADGREQALHQNRGKGDGRAVAAALLFKAVW